MPNYRRAQLPGATYFFTVNCAVRHNNKVLINNIDLLRESFSEERRKRPFRIDAIVILPEHLHCIWTLPDNDADFAIRWRQIKRSFSRRIKSVEKRSVSRQLRGERGIWQRRYWEHQISDAGDYQRHVDYIHWNPIKHGWVDQVRKWPHSSFHSFVKKGVYASNWGDNLNLTHPSK